MINLSQSGFFFKVLYLILNGAHFYFVLLNNAKQLPKFIRKLNKKRKRKEIKKGKEQFNSERGALETTHTFNLGR